MGECTKGLYPDNARVADSTEVNNGKYTIKDVVKKMAKNPKDNSLSAEVAINVEPLLTTM